MAGGDFWHLAVISGGVILMMLICLLLGWLFVRRALLPPIPAKLPPSGARPWSRFRVPNPNSLLLNVPVRSGPTYGPSATNALVIDSVPTDFVPPSVGSGSAPTRPMPPVKPDTASLLSTGGGMSPLESERASAAALLAVSHGGASGKPGQGKKKKRGLLARAPYYADQTAADHSRGLS